MIQPLAVQYNPKVVRSDSEGLWRALGMRTTSALRARGVLPLQVLLF